MITIKYVINSFNILFFSIYKCCFGELYMIFATTIVLQKIKAPKYIPKPILNAYGS